VVVAHNFVKIDILNEVTLRRTRLVVGWVSSPGFNSRCQKPVSIYIQLPRSTQPCYPSVGRAMSTSQRAVMLCGFRVKVGMVRVWVSGKTDPLAITGHIWAL